MEESSLSEPLPPFETSGPVGGRYLRSVTWLGLAKVFEMGLSLLFIALITRRLGVAEMGKYYAIRSLVSLLSIVPEMGLDGAFVRLVSRTPERAREYLGVALVVRNTLSLVALAIILTASVLARRESDIAHATLLAALYMLTDLAVSTNNSVFLVCQKTQYELVLSIFFGVLSIPFVLGALSFLPGVVGLFAGLAVANALTMILGWVITTRQFLRPVFTWTPALWREMLGLTMTIGLMRGSRVAYDRVDTQLLLALIPGAASARYAAVAIYNTAYNLVRRTAPLQTILARPLLPLASRAADDVGRLRVLHRRSFTLFLLMGVPSALLLSFGAPFVIRQLTGRQAAAYAPASPLLAFLSLLLLTTFASSSTRVVLSGLGLQRYLLRQGLTVLAINVVLDVVLIPLFARSGAAWWAPAVASVCAECYALAVLLLEAHRRIGIFPDGRDASCIALGGVCMAGSMVLAARVAPAAAFVIGPVVFAVVAFATGIVRRTTGRRLLFRHAE
jgi:O-antigen/teichoic acid export membrane protein